MSEDVSLEYLINNILSDADGLKRNLRVNIESSVTPSGSSIGDGSKDVAVAGTAEVLGGDVDTKSILITAKDTNTGKVYIGGSTVSSTSGMFIYPGQTVTINIDNLNKVYLDVEVGTNGVVFTYIA